MWTLWGQYRISSHDGTPVLNLPVKVTYVYRGTEVWNGVLSHRIEAHFSSRYPLQLTEEEKEDGPSVDYQGPITSTSGSHQLTIMIPTEGDLLLFIRDEINAAYQFGDGTGNSYRGHSLLFVNRLTTENRDRIAESVEEELREEDIEIDETDTGVRLTINALRFLPDQAELLPQEKPRLDSIARSLSRVGDARFLIVGHTADIGSEASQQRLSEERAEVIARELVARGIDPNRLDLQGRGGTEPVASNETEAGRRQNRRVEVYILEQ
jgi:outer membrane protein OmpA-like peptidoglycan-associated protein